jgi:lambda family phage minor tail protein L
VKNLHPDLIAEKNKLDTPSAWLTLVQLSVNSSTTLYFVGNPASVTFDGQLYSPYPFQIQTAKQDSRGGLAEMEVHVSNVTREISAYLEANELRGRRVRLIGVNSANLADPTKIAFDETYEITSIDVTEQVATFHLGHERLLQHRFPQRRALRDNCQWVYKSVECGFADATHLGYGTVSSAGTTVTGVNTKFLTAFKPGDSLTAAGQTRIVQQVNTDLELIVTVAPSPAWSGATFTLTKPTCDQILTGKNGCRAHFGQTGPGRFGGFPAMPIVAGRLWL